MTIIYGTPDSERSLLRKMPCEIGSIEDMGGARAALEKKARESSGFLGGMRRWSCRRKAGKIGRGLRDQLYPGAVGEKAVLERLSKLDGQYSVFCDVRIRLPHYIAYKGRKNLRSAQMDFVVVCHRGVFVIEAKNWSDEHVRTAKWSPHEQTDRAGKVMWAMLGDSVGKVRVTSVLVAIRDNIRHDPAYGIVVVSDIDKLQAFVESQSVIIDFMRNPSTPHR